MATLANKETNIRAVLGERAAAFWLSSELQHWYLDGQNEILGRVPFDALKTLVRYKNQTFSGSSTLSAPTTDIILETLVLTVEESDGDQGEPWLLVSPNVMREVMAQEGYLEQDATDTRIFSVSSLPSDSTPADPTGDAGFTLYPTPASGRASRLQFIIKPTESGNLTLPLNLQRLAEYFAIARAASKMSRDLDMSSKYDALFNDGIERINRQFAGQYGLDNSKRVFIIDTQGYG